jgi:flagella basal body P-ring formation protein FlgA
MKRPVRARLVILMLSAAQVFAASARGAMQDTGAVTTAITQAVTAAIPAGATVTLGPVTGAQYMQACAGPLAVTVTGTEPYEQAGVHCDSPGWTLYVTVTVAQSAKVVIAGRPIAAGQTIQPGDLALHSEPVSLYAGRQVFYDPAALAGGTALMTLPAGTILTQSAIGEPLIVKAGQTVSVQVLSGGVDLSVSARADENGRIGDTIMLTNPSSGQRFTAVVTASGPVVQLQ